MIKCLLCLNVTFQKNAIDTLDEQDCGSSAEDMIKQHFWFSSKVFDNNELQNSKVLCKSCWSKLENFHEFFCAVKFNYQIPDEIVIIEEVLDEISEAKVETPIKESHSECLPEKELETEITFDNTIMIERLSTAPERSVRSTKKRPEEKDFNFLSVKVSKTTVRNSHKKRRIDLLQEEENLMKENAEMTCEVCSEPIKDWKDSKSHYRTHNRLGFIRCCKRKIDRISEMIDHLSWHKDPNIFTCMTCGKVLMTREYLLTHEASHIPEDERQFQCPFCPKKFGSTFSLSLHKRTHKKDLLDATLPCLQCPDKKFKTEKQLKLHIETCHNASESFLCHLCSKELKSKNSLEIHVKNHEQPEQPIECKICGHFLKNKRRFAIHMTRHKQADAGPYACTHCDKLFKHQHAVQSHIAFVHTSRRFNCDLCDKAFKHEINLKEHLAHHTGVDLYQCPFCSKTFKSNGNMHSHKKKMHPEEYSKLPPASYIQPQSKTD